MKIYIASDKEDIVYIFKTQNIYNIYQREKKIGSFHFKPMPGQCGIAILYSSEIEDKYIEKLHEFGLKMAGKLGYTRLICTYTSDQKLQVTVMTKLKFKLIDQFRNQRTGNKVLMFSKEPLRIKLK